MSDKTETDKEAVDGPGCENRVVGHSIQETDGGLVWCDCCRGAEGSLPTDCPGRRMTDDEESRVYAGSLDFKKGAWVLK